MESPEGTKEPARYPELLSSLPGLDGGGVCSQPSLFTLTPAGDFSVLVEIDNPNLGLVTKLIGMNASTSPFDSVVTAITLIRYGKSRREDQID